MRPRARYLTIAAADVAGGLTVAVLAVSSLRFAYRSPPLHATLETASAIIALLAAWLSFGRVRHSAQLSDLLLFMGLLCLALSNFVFSALPWSLLDTATARFSVWTTIVGMLVGASCLAAASTAPVRRLRRPRRGAFAALAVSGILLGAAAVSIALWGSTLPLGIDPATVPDALSYPSLGAPAIAGPQFAGALLFILAAVGFTRRAESTGDEFFAWLGASSVVAAIARIDFVLFPSLYSDWVHVGDVLRLGSYVLILVGVAREIARYQRMLAFTIAMDERRRLAHNLHDGLAQELAFIATQSRAAAAGQPTSRELHWIASAAQRALDESRRAIVALTAPVDKPLDVALAETAEELAQRFGTITRVQAEPGIDAPPETRETVLRVIREAVTNASRHGGAHLIEIRLSSRHGLHLRVTDDGIGFDATAATGAGGFGLVTMRERVEALGGEFLVSSKPAEGAEIEVTIP